MIERRTQAIMDRLEGLLGNKSGSRNRGAHSRESSREPRGNFHEHPNRGRTFGCTRGRGKPSGNATRKIAQGVPRKSDEALLAAERLRTNDLCETQI